jgi:hypothetical protein
MIEKAHLQIQVNSSPPARFPSTCEGHTCPRKEQEILLRCPTSDVPAPSPELLSLDHCFCSLTIASAPSRRLLKLSNDCFCSLTIASAFSRRFSESKLNDCFCSLTIAQTFYRLLLLSLDDCCNSLASALS